MDLEAFLSSLKAPAPPAGLCAEVEALWWARRGAWDRAHETVQRLSSLEAAWVHAHLHRIEGDLGNAAYWYRRAGRPLCTESLEREWREIAAALLARRGT